MSEPAWSYSRVKTFDQCPRKYNHLYVLKNISEKESQAMKYGHEVHKAAECYIRDGLPLEPRFNFMEKQLNMLNGIAGDKYCERKMGITSNYTPCGYFADNIWLRTVADLLIIDGAVAYLVDYKTGKNAKYADTKQLDLMAGSVFVHYPEVERIKSALIYVVSGDFISVDHTRDERDRYLSTFRPELHRLKGAMESGVWNAVDSPLCGWCPVKTCEHWYKPKNRG